MYSGKSIFSLQAICLCAFIITWPWSESVFERVENFLGNEIIGRTWCLPETKVEDARHKRRQTVEAWCAYHLSEGSKYWPTVSLSPSPVIHLCHQPHSCVLSDAPMPDCIQSQIIRAMCISTMKYTVVEIQEPCLKNAFFTYRCWRDLAVQFK